MAPRKNKKSKKVRFLPKMNLLLEQTHLVFFAVVLVIAALFMLIGSFVSPQRYYLSYADSRDLEAKVVTHEAAPAMVFSDVTYKDANYKAIAYLKDQKILGGYKDGSFQPKNAIDRAGFAKALVAALNANPSAVTYHDCAKDVGNEWFAPSLCYLKAKAFMKGYADGGLRPSFNIKKNEVVKMVVVAFLGEPKAEASQTVFTGDWFDAYLPVAQKYELLEPNFYTQPSDFNADATRGQVAEILYRAVTHLRPTI